MITRDMSARSGFSLAEIMITLAIAAVVGTFVWQYAPDLLGRSKGIALQTSADSMNRSTSQFVGSGGEITADESPTQVLAQLQTPVDASSQRAGYGIFPLISYTWTLTPVGQSFDGPRLTYNYDQTTKRGVWNVASSGDGYLLVEDLGKASPATADWSARVNRAGITGARVDNWVWDSKDKAVNTVAGDVVSTPSVGGPMAGAIVTITGPGSVTYPGSYSWTGTATQAGSLTITVAGEAKSASAATQVRSVEKVFHAGDKGSLDIVLQRSEGGSITKTVDVDVPASPEISISGPSSVTTTDPIVWTATCTTLSMPIVISVDGVRKELNGATTIASDAISYPSGTNKTITISASAINNIGIAKTSLTVSIDVAAPDPTPTPSGGPSDPSDPTPGPGPGPGPTPPPGGTPTPPPDPTPTPDPAPTWTWSGPASITSAGNYTYTLSQTSGTPKNVRSIAVLPSSGRTFGDIGSGSSSVSVVVSAGDNGSMLDLSGGYGPTLSSSTSGLDVPINFGSNNWTFTLVAKGLADPLPAGYSVTLELWRINPDGSRTPMKGDTQPINPLKENWALIVGASYEVVGYYTIDPSHLKLGMQTFVPANGN